MLSGPSASISSVPAPPLDPGAATAPEQVTVSRCIAENSSAQAVQPAPFHFLNPAPTLSFGQVLGGCLSTDAACPLLLLALLGARLPGFCGPLVYLGRISYGLYVFHHVIRLFVGIVAESRLHAHPQLLLPATYLGSPVLTVTVAAASYHFFERPFLKLKDRFTFIPSRAA